MQLLKQIKRLFSRDEPHGQEQRDEPHVQEQTLTSPPSLEEIRKEIARLEEAVRMEKIAQQQRPKRTQEDVERIIRRDFSLERFDFIVSTLNAYESGEGQEATRVRLAILKLANGDWFKVASYVELAIRDYREVLGPAEYPGYVENLKERLRLGQWKVPEDKERLTKKSDRDQYDEWLQK